MNFRRAIIIAELWRPEVERRRKKIIFAFFGKRTHYEKFFKILFRKNSSRYRSTCYVQISWNWRQIGNVVRYLPDKKKQKFRLLCSSRYCADRTQNLPGPAPDNVLRLLQILSKSCQYRRSYIRTRERRRKNPIFGWSLASSRIIQCFLTLRDFNLGGENIISYTALLFYITAVNEVDFSKKPRWKDANCLNLLEVEFVNTTPLYVSGLIYIGLLHFLI